MLCRHFKYMLSHLVPYLTVLKQQMKSHAIIQYFQKPWIYFSLWLDKNTNIYEYYYSRYIKLLGI
jgi:hypothetical protein